MQNITRVTYSQRPTTATTRNEPYQPDGEAVSSQRFILWLRDNVTVTGGGIAECDELEFRYVNG